MRDLLGEEMSLSAGIGRVEEESEVFESEGGELGEEI